MDKDSQHLVTHPGINKYWLGLVAEPALEPDLPIVDPHHHLWDREGGYFAQQLLKDLAQGHRVVATVHVQCHHGYFENGPQELRPVGETQFAVAMAHEAQKSGARARVCSGIVGFADLQLGDKVQEVLQAHISEGQGLFRGIRRLNAQDDSFRTHLPSLPSGLLADTAFRKGFAQLAPLGLSFDAWMFHPQLDELIELADAFPQTSIILDHVGTPLGVGQYRGKEDEVFRHWSAKIERLSQRPQVTVKLGGLGMAFTGFEFHKRALPPTSDVLANAWRPYIERCIEAFGTDRCMFESNFPVDKASSSYGVLWNAFKRLSAGASVSEKKALFAGTAARVYRLDVPELREGKT